MDLISYFEEFAEDLSQANTVDATNWEGEAGGRGIRALTRYIYHAPPGDNLTAMDNMMARMTPFLIVSVKCFHLSTPPVASSDKC